MAAAAVAAARAPRVREAFARRAGVPSTRQPPVANTRLRYADAQTNPIGSRPGGCATLHGYTGVTGSRFPSPGSPVITPSPTPPAGLLRPTAYWPPAPRLVK